MTARPTAALQVGEDAAAGVPASGVAREGGDTPTARKCTYMELALCLAPGLDVNGISILYKAAKPSLQVSTALSFWNNSTGPCAALAGNGRIAYGCEKAKPQYGLLRSRRT